LIENRPMHNMDHEPSSMAFFMNLMLQRGWYILVCIIALLIPVIIYNQSATPTYQASTTIIYEEPLNTVGVNIPNDYHKKETLINQIQEIQSRSVALDVVAALPQDVLKKIQLPEQIDKNFDLNKYYAAVIRSSVKAAPVSESDVIQIDAEASDGLSAMVITNTVTKVLTERNLRLRKDEVSGVRAHIEEQRQRYKEQLDVAESRLKQYKMRNRITSLSKENEGMLATITHIDKLYQESKTAREKEESNLQGLNDRISTNQQNLVPSISDVSSKMVQQLREQLTKLQDQYFQLKLQNVPEDNPRMAEMRANMQRIQNNLVAEAKKMAEANNLIDPLSQMSKLYEEKINSELAIQSLQAEESSYKKAMGGYESQLGTLPAKEYELARLTRERDLANEIYVMLSEKWEEARISEAEKVGNLRIIDKAELPKTPIRPRKNLNLAVALLFALTLGFGLAFFLESIDTSIKTQEEVEKKTGLSILGAIPHFHGTERKETNKEVPANALITYLMPSSPASEAYRTLRTNLQFSKLETICTIMLTSSGPREGKSTTVANLAVATAQMGLKTLVIDADLRRPTVHKIFSLHRDPGLADVLLNFSNNDEILNSDSTRRTFQEDSLNSDVISEEKIPLHQASVRASKTVQKIASLDTAITAAVQPTVIDKLEVLTCGVLPPNPSEQLASETMRDLLALVKEKYEMVIIDAPPLIAVTDAAVLAPHVDGVALIIESGQNDREIILKAKSLLDRVGVNFMGAILNNVREKNLYGDYNYYYTYYAKSKDNAEPA
jgi:capsular exopolysaccharide synthesis family protein